MAAALSLNKSSFLSSPIGLFFLTSPLLYFLLNKSQHQLFSNSVIHQFSSSTGSSWSKWSARNINCTATSASFRCSNSISKPCSYGSTELAANIEEQSSAIAILATLTMIYQLLRELHVARHGLRQ
jgi:hypothetical protein